MRYTYICPSMHKFCVGYGRYGIEERRMNLIADVLQYELTRNGIKTARSDTEMTICEAVADANARECNSFISIRSQSADARRRGCEIYYFDEYGNGKRLAFDITDRLSLLTQIKAQSSAKVYGGLAYYELRKTKAPSVIVAVGFHDNPKDADFIIDTTYELGVEIARGVSNYYGIEYRNDSKESQTIMRASYNGVIF